MGKESIDYISLGIFNREEVPGFTKEYFSNSPDSKLLLYPQGKFRVLIQYRIIKSDDITAKLNDLDYRIEALKQKPTNKYEILVKKD